MLIKEFSFILIDIDYYRLTAPHHSALFVKHIDVNVN